ncbi:beta-ketoacyl synthase chain length factor [Acerihabitans sp. TG2]|uniref:beta-ketoacyl synthase chain length factor n=1 Tax=Acerihabitans sp. TG2 TaxID=3096008 RepID=UPI002B23971B|nr:beta-ketoacyl synthase chain length factor [Acerihabitans sp. TG2]MEA9390026.1 beta-ketoacyl synthase chain length factor [Acerihabitans sp. TG2]
MNIALNILDWQASAPGLSTHDHWRKWSLIAPAISADAPLPNCPNLPMMTARRLSAGSRLAVDNGLALLRRHQPEAVVFTSRHGELERNQRILDALAQQHPLSPTDFTMSVHNAAVGSLTIVGNAPLVSTSLSAGEDSFQQGLVEALVLIKSGYQRVLLVDFDNHIPAFYHPLMASGTPNYPYATALLLTAGETLHCVSQPLEGKPLPRVLPQSLRFLHSWLSGKREFSITGERLRWRWSCQ